MPDVTSVNYQSVGNQVIDDSPSGTKVKSTAVVGANSNVTVSKAEDAKLGKMMMEAFETLHDLEPPKNMSAEQVVTYLDQMSAKLSEIGSELAQEALHAATIESKHDTEKRVEKIHQNFKHMREMKKKQKLMKALCIFGASLSVVVAAASLGTASGPAAVACAALSGVAAAASVTNAVVQVSGVMENASPAAKKAFGLAMMIIQMACALASVAAAVKGAISAAGSVAGASVKAGSAAVESTATAGESAATTAMEEVVKDAAKVAAKEAAKDAMRDAAKATAKEVSEAVAKGAGEETVKEIVKESVKKVAQKTAVELCQKVAKQTGQQMSRELAEKVAKGVTEEVAKEMTEQVAKQAGGQAAKVVGQVAGQVAKEATTEVAKSTGQAIATHMVAQTIGQCAAVLKGGTDVATGVETIEMGSLTKDIGDTRSDIIKLEARLKLNQEIIEKMIDWLKDIGDNYMNSQKKIQDYATDVNQSAMQAIDGVTGLVGPGSNAS